MPVTSTAGSDYTWDTATFTYDSADADKNFDQASTVSYYLSIDEVLAFAESLSKRIGLFKSELSVSVADSLRQSIRKGIAEALTVVDSYTDVNAFFVRVFENIAIAEALSKRVNKAPFQEGIAFTESSNRAFGLRTTDQSIGTFLDSLAQFFGKRPNETVSFAETLSRLITKPLSESFSTVESSSRKPSKAFPESIGTVTDSAPRIAFGKNPSETISFLEQLPKSFNKKLSDSLGTITESAFRRISKNIAESIQTSFSSWDENAQTWDDTTTAWEGTVNMGQSPLYDGTFPSLLISEEFRRNLVLRDRLSEVVSVAEALSKRFMRQFSESFVVTQSSYYSRFGLSFAESFSSDDDLRRSIKKVSAETLAVAEQRAFAFFQKLDETTAFSESVKRATFKAFNESLTLAEENRKNLVLKSLLNESFAIAESASRLYAKMIQRTLSITEGLVRRVVLNKPRSISFVETFPKRVSYFRSFVELPVSIAETQFNKFGLRPIEEIGVFSDSNELPLTFGKNVARSLAVSETFVRSIAYERVFFSSVRIVDQAVRRFTKRNVESFAVLEEYLRKANAIVSDIVLDNVPLDDATFRGYVDLGVIPGYAPFKPFVAGDYPLKDALFKLVMESETNDRARVSNLRVDIDVPDVVNRGTAIITDANAGVTITFPRPFYVTPDITVTLKGGATTGTPRVTTVTPTSVTIHLLNSAGAFVTGTISWVAQGY